MANRKPRKACFRGHPYNEKNTYTRPSGVKECRICRRPKRKKTSYAIPAKWCDSCKFPQKTKKFKCSECGGSLRLERDEPTPELTNGWSAIIGDEDVHDKGAVALIHQVKTYVMVKREKRAVAIYYGKGIVATVRSSAINRITISLNETHKQWKQIAPTLHEAMQMVSLKDTA